MKFFKYLLAISMMQMIEFKGLETKILKLYTSYDGTYKSRHSRLTRNRRKFDYDYEYWEKNIDSNNNIKLITRKYDAHDLVFNTVNAIYGLLRENNNVTTNTGTDDNDQYTELTLTPANPTSESKMTVMSSISDSNTDVTATTAPVKLFTPDLTTLGNGMTSFSANDTTTFDQGLIMSKIEPESTTITSISKETPTIDGSISKFSIISTDSRNTGETTRDWREIIDFTVIPEHTVADLLLLYANTTPHAPHAPHAPGTTLKPPPSVNPTEFLFTTKKYFDFTVTTIVTKNPILAEIEEQIQKTKDGFFTSSLLVLLKTLMGKNELDVDSLLHGMDIAIVSMSKDESLSMFNATVLEVFQSAIQMLLVEPADVRKDHLLYAIYALENRRTFLLPDINALFSVVDTVYIADDVIKIADFIRDEVAGFPNTTKDPSSIARQAIELFIILPHLRVKGTAKEELLMMGLNAVIKSRMFAGQMDRRRAGDEKISRKIIGQPIGLWNKEVTKSLRHYPRRLNKLAQTTLTFLLTREKWKHTSINNKISMRKMKSSIDNYKLHSIKSNTKPTYKLRRHHSNKQDLIGRKIYPSKINATRTYKFKRKNTNTQTITENTEHVSSAGQDSETSSSEDIFDSYSKNRSITKNINQHKDPHLSIYSNNHRKQNNNHGIQLKGLNNFNRNEKSNLAVEKNNIKDKLVDWLNKYTNVIYQKLKNENMPHSTKAYLRDAFILIAKRKSYGSHGGKLNKNVFNTAKFNFGNNDLVQKERKSMEITSYENDEETILKFNILKSRRNTSSRSNSNLTNRKKLQDNEVIKAELIKLVRKNTNIIKRTLNKNMATTNMQINRVKSKSLKESSYEIDDEINLKNKILAVMKNGFKTAVENRKPIGRGRKNTVVYSADEEKELRANLYALFRKNSLVSKQARKVT